MLEDQGSLRMVEADRVVFCSGQGHNIAKDTCLPSSFVCDMTVAPLGVFFVFCFFEKNT